MWKADYPSITMHTARILLNRLAHFDERLAQILRIIWLKRQSITMHTAQILLYHLAHFDERLAQILRIIWLKRHSFSVTFEICLVPISAGTSTVLT
jgi:hypothetical protein